MVRRQEANKDVAHGVVWGAGGVVVTVVSYMNAVEFEGGSYWVAYGAILYGSFRTVTGMWALWSLRK